MTLETITLDVDAKSGARNSRSDKQRIRDIRKAARSIQDMTVEMEPADEDAPDNVLITFGDEIKALGNGRIGGYLVRFTDANQPDLDNDFFTKETDYDIADGDKVTIYYNHGLDPLLKRRKLGQGTVAIQDVGVWVEAQLQLRDEYENAIYKLVSQGKLGWSSGTLPNLVERESQGKAMWVKAWPLGKDASITPTPAAGPNLTAAQPLKSWAEATQSLQALTQQVAGDATTQDATASNDKAIRTKKLFLELDLLTL